MQLLKRLEQHDQTQTARIAAGEARSPFHFVHIGGVMPEQVACSYHTRKPRVCGALEVRHNHQPSERVALSLTKDGEQDQPRAANAIFLRSSEKHTSELQSIIRNADAVV